MQLNKWHSLRVWWLQNFAPQSQKSVINITNWYKQTGDHTAPESKTSYLLSWIAEINESIHEQEINNKIARNKYCQL